MRYGIKHEENGGINRTQVLNLRILQKFMYTFHQPSILPTQPTGQQNNQPSNVDKVPILSPRFARLLGIKI